LSASLTATPDGALPFAAFLDDLRRRGLAIGVRESALFYRLLARFEGDLTSELRDAIAALLARNQAEVALIRRVFDDSFTAEPPPPLPPVPPVRSRWPWIAGLLAAAALTIAAWASVHHVRPDVPPPPANSQPPPRLPPASGNVSPQPPLPEPVTVEVPRLSWDLVRSPWPYLVWLGSAGAVLLALAAVRRSRGRGTAMRSELRSRMAAVPGPQHFPIAVPPYRGLGADALDRHLDIDRSVRSTVRHGRPVLVFGDRPPASALIVLEDVGPEMRPWRRKVAAFVTGLEQRGVPIERWTFDTHAVTVSSRAHGAPVPLAALTGAAEGALLVVVSTGMGVLGEQRALNRWVRELAAFPARVWLNPIADETRWRGGLARAPMPVLPLAGPSLAHAARVLGADVPEAALRTPASAPAPADAVDQVRQLAALLPIADPDLLMWLRESFLSDVPEQAVLDVLEGQATWGGRRLTWQPGERAAALARMRRGHPGRELQVRRRLVELFDDNEPPAGTAAHLRWRLARAEQAAFLTPDDTAAARRELAALAASPLGEETDHVLAFLAAGPAGSGAGRGVMPSAASHHAMRSIRAGARRERRRAVRPAGHGLRRTDLLRAVVAGALVVGAVSLQRDRMIRLPNAENAYELALDAGPPAWLLHRGQPPRGAGGIQIQDVLGNTEAGSPARAQAPGEGDPAVVARPKMSGAPLRGRVLVDGETIADDFGFFTGSFLFVEGGRGHWYQLQARLPSGGWALSNQLLVPLPETRPAPRPTTGTLVVHLFGPDRLPEPNAITVDGNPQSTGAKIVVTAGDHEVSAKLPDFDPGTMQVTVPAGEAQVLEMVLRPRQAAPGTRRGPCARGQGGQIFRVSSSSCPKISPSRPSYALIAKSEKALGYECTEIFDCEELVRVLALSIPPSVAPRDVLVNGKPWDGALLAAGPGDEITIELQDPRYEFKQTFTITAGQRTLEVKAAPTFGLLVVERPVKSSADYKLRPEMQEVVRLRDQPAPSGGLTRTYRGRAGSYEVFHSAGSSTATVEVGKTAQIAIGPAAAPGPDGTTPHPGVSPAEATAWVNAHNQFRARHCASPLRWSDKLAEVAQHRADELRVSGCGAVVGIGTVGENVETGFLLHDPESVVASWYDEIARYHFPDGESSIGAGSFTQVVWRSTTQVGCGHSQCSGKDIFVCAYSPGGNQDRQYRDNVLPVDCDPARPTSPAIQQPLPVVVPQPLSHQPPAQSQQPPAAQPSRSLDDNAQQPANKDRKASDHKDVKAPKK
jgi:uncharacterized protein YkwD